jgi:plasmid stabilization system protein ParE
VDFQVRIEDPALIDLEDILEYSWAKFPANAERFGNDLLNHVDLLGIFPYMGSPVPGRPSVRQLIHTPILIYYLVRERPDVVEILHFRHASRRGGFF